MESIRGLVRKWRATVNSRLNGEKGHGTRSLGDKESYKPLLNSSLWKLCGIRYSDLTIDISQNFLLKWFLIAAEYLHVDPPLTPNRRNNFSFSCFFFFYKRDTWVCLCFWVGITLKWRMLYVRPLRHNTSEF